MMIKLSKEEVEAACAHWLKAKEYIDPCRQTTPSLRVAIHTGTEVVCKLTRSGVECTVNALPESKGKKP